MESLSKAVQSVFKLFKGGVKVCSALGTQKGRRCRCIEGTTDVGEAWIVAADLQSSGLAG